MIKFILIFKIIYLPKNMPHDFFVKKEVFNQFYKENLIHLVEPFL